jgi:GNAT superfamily N-acetyltransferase
MGDAMNLRRLTLGDESLLEAFLVSHVDSSMFLRGNARRAGLSYSAKPYQAIYAGAFRDGCLIGVAAFSWNGLVLLQAPEHAAELARACVAWGEHPVRGLAGPAAQVHEARSALRHDRAEAALEGNEGLFALDLPHLVVPEALASGALVCRTPRPEERDTLRAWRLAYDIELLGATDSPESRRRSATFLDAQIADGNAWIAIDAGAPVSLSAFNAALPDIVQLGGVYTPPTLRGRGFARAVVAASLLAARARGASRAVLCTRNPSAARACEALGFRRVGDYSIVLLR